MRDLFIGLMSGTSADGIDAVLVDFQSHAPLVLAHHYEPYSPSIRDQILAIMQPSENEILTMGVLDRQLGELFGSTVLTLLQKSRIQADTIRGIGSHGQTIRHYPHIADPFTLQIGDPNIIATRTNITTIADFRRKDMALGGQGAPLVPRFHQAMFQTNHARAVVNIGGIANVTILPSTDDTRSRLLGFDTGPGNALLDAWCTVHCNKPYDEHGQWARSGAVDTRLLDALLSDAYFNMPAPKSTGRDYFQLAWLEQYLSQHHQQMTPQNIAATLTELTAKSIIDAICATDSHAVELILCGGGVHNHYLVERLEAIAPPDCTIMTSDKLGVHPNLVEAVAFAWLAKQTLDQKPGNLPSVTGAQKEAILGGVYRCS